MVVFIKISQHFAENVTEIFFYQGSESNYEELKERANVAYLDLKLNQ